MKKIYLLNKMKGIDKLWKQLDGIKMMVMKE